jgi:hypothetical protein
VYKFFTNKDIVKKRFERSHILKPFVPLIIKKTKYFYVYKFINGVVFSKLKNKRKEFLKLLDWLNKTLWKKKVLTKNKSSVFEQKCNNFYYEKSLSRINYLYEKNNINDKAELIDNVKTPKISSMFEKINWRDINNGIPVNFHGDLHFENIIKSKNKITLLDWIEYFSNIKNYVDIYYYLAKINHGLIVNHNMIKLSKFSVNINKKKVKINYHQSNEDKECQKILYKFLKKKNIQLKKLKFLLQLFF